MQTNKKVHCEQKGNETSLDKTRVMTKISGIINLKHYDNPQIDFEEKMIYSLNKPTIKFFSKLYVPKDFKPVLGDLFATVADEDELEQTTHILSDEGRNQLMGSQLIKLVTYLVKYDVINFPDTMFFVSDDEISSFKTQSKTCENWGVEYPSLGKKYMIKKILDTKIENPFSGILWPGFDAGVNDSSSKNPNGTGYLFRTDRIFTPVNLCSNESAVDYCDKNNCIAYYTDFINGGKMRVLTKYTESINKNLQNVYSFRSSNI